VDYLAFAVMATLHSRLYSYTIIIIQGTVAPVIIRVHFLYAYENSASGSLAQLCLALKRS